jgi:hypothetical protein
MKYVCIFHVRTGRKRKVKAMSHVTYALMYAIKAKLQVMKFLERANQLNMEALVSTVKCSNRPIVQTFGLGIYHNSIGLFIKPKRAWIFYNAVVLTNADWYSVHYLSIMIRVSEYVRWSNWSRNLGQLEHNASGNWNSLEAWVFLYCVDLCNLHTDAFSSSYRIDIRKWDPVVSITLYLQEP